MEATFPLVRRGKRNANYTAISNGIIDHPTLGPEARITLIYLLSKPDDWQLQIVDVRRLLGSGGVPCGRNKVYAVIRELKSSAYVVAHEELRHGRFHRLTYYVFDEPLEDPEAFKRSLSLSDAASEDKVIPLNCVDSAPCAQIGETVKPPRARIGETAPPPCAQKRDPVKRHITKDRKKQITEPPPPSPSDLDASDMTQEAAFADLWELWPVETRPQERQLAESLFNRLPHTEKLQAVELCSLHLKSLRHQGRYSAMIPYLRNREYLSFIDAPELTTDGYFRIFPQSNEWKAWMEHLSRTISAKTLASQEKLGYMLVRTRLPLRDVKPPSNPTLEHRRNGSARILNEDPDGSPDGELNAVLSRLTAKFANARPKRVRPTPATRAPQKRIAHGG